MVWLGPQTLGQVKIIDKNNFNEYIEPSVQDLDVALSRRCGGGLADEGIGAPPGRRY
jgi:hypothetical protein